MLNITIAIDEETYRAARLKAAAQGSSVSALVKQFLQELAARDARFAALAAEEEEIRASIEGFDASYRLQRDEIYRSKTAAAGAGCTELITEDLNHGQEIGAVGVVNPFRSC